MGIFQPGCIAETRGPRRARAAADAGAATHVVSTGCDRKARLQGLKPFFPRSLTAGLKPRPSGFDICFTARSKARPSEFDMYGAGCSRKSVRAALRIVLCVAMLAESNCGTAGTPAGLKTPPANVTVTISPASATLFLGATQQFGASVTGSSNTGVTWEVNGAVGGAAGTGTISAGGLYTAPGILPASGSASVTAVSQADPGATASATVSFTGNIVSAFCGRYPCPRYCPPRENEYIPIGKIVIDYLI